MIVRSVCPCCGSEDLFLSLKAIDHTVSHEEFEIWQCRICTLKFTQDVPGKEEIAAYYKSENYISHSDTDKGFIYSLYHRIRQITLISKKKLITRYTGLPMGKILDVGCGTGSFLNTMHAAGWEVTGIEPDEATRKKAKQLYGLEVQEPGMLFETAPESLDAITMWHVLEHVHDLHEYTEQLRKIIKPGGYLFIAVPNYTCYDQTIYGASWAAYDVPRHLYHFSPAAMKRLLSDHHLELKAIKPMYFDSFYVSMLSEKYKSGKNNSVKAFFNGFVSNYKAFKDNEKCSSLTYIVTSIGNRHFS